MRPVDRDESGAECAAVPVERLRDLQGQLAGGHQDQRGRRLAAIAVGESLEDRQREGGGLARAGRGLSEQVPARDEHRDGRRLDGGRLLVPEVRQRAEQFGAETQVGEGVVGTFALRGHYGTVPKCPAPCACGNRSMTSVGLGVNGTRAMSRPTEASRRQFPFPNRATVEGRCPVGGPVW